MEAERSSVFQLFDQSKRHVVPLYQRPYVWTKKGQWDPLWEDVKELTENAVAQRKSPPHFVGAVVRAQAPAPGLRLDTRLVIDGQQRLTTLQVLLAVARDHLIEMSAAAGATELGERLSDLRDTFQKLTTNTGAVKGPEERFKVWPTNADRDAFKQVVTAGSRSAVDAAFPVAFKGKRMKEAVPDQRLLVEAYRFFDERLTELRASLGPTAEEGEVSIFDGLRAALDRLMLVVIDLGADEDPQEIFETLNFRGAPLLASDLVKNFLFGRAQIAQLPVEELYEKHWRHFDLAEMQADFWKRELSVGRLKRRLFDVFLEHYLVCKGGGEFVSSRHLYNGFQEWWGTNSNRDVIAELSELGRHSQLWRSFHFPDEVAPQSRRLAGFYRRLRALDTTTVFPLLLFLFGDHGQELGPNGREEVAGIIESFLVRRAVIGLTAKNLNRLFGALLKDLQALPQVTPTAVRAGLAAGSGVDLWPTDQEFEAGWLNEEVYSRLKSGGTAALLLALNEALTGPKQESVVLPEGLTVEHMLPQSWESHWPAPAADSNTETEAPVVRRNRLLHTLGNLTVLTQPLNGALSNAGFESKRVEIEKSLLVLNRYFSGLKEWNEAAIIERGRALFQTALKTWPR